MSVKRKSAFAVYSETERIDENVRPKKHNNDESINQPKFLQSKLNLNGSNAKNIDSPATKKSSKRELKEYKNSSEHLTSANLKGISKRRKKNLMKSNKNLKLDKDFINSTEIFTHKPISKTDYLKLMNMSDLKPVATKIKEPSKKVNKSKDDDAFREEVIKMLMQESERERAKKPKKEKPKEMKKEGKSKSVMEDDFDESEVFDSKEEALKMFQSIIHPITIKQFFDEYWEKKPLLVKRKNPIYYKSWFSCKEFHSILREHCLEFTQNIDVTTYINGVKEKHNLEGRACAPIVWDFFQQGCSIRFLNPQTYSKHLWKYLSVLQDFFCSCVGANIYLTPAGCQGFAPHFDDIEAFVLQLEGKKRWRVYKPRNEAELLPRMSSRNFDQNEIGEPVIDCILETGDLLYFPRGWIHQANACDDIHSLHITVSTYQKNTYGDFIAKLIPAAVEIAVQENSEFRKGLPLNYLDFCGAAHENDKKKRNDSKDFINQVAKLCDKLVKNYLPIHATADQMAKGFIHESLPPYLSHSESTRSIHGHGEIWNESTNQVEGISEIEPDTEIKLLRRNCIRLAKEEKSCVLFHNLENSRLYQEKEVQYMEVDAEALPAIEYLIAQYPKYVKVEKLPMKNIEAKITVASCLYDKGIIVTSSPLKPSYESDSESDEEDEGESGDEDELVDMDEGDVVEMEDDEEGDDDGEDEDDDDADDDDDDNDDNSDNSDE